MCKHFVTLILFPEEIVIVVVIVNVTLINLLLMIFFYSSGCSQSIWIYTHTSDQTSTKLWVPAPTAGYKTSERQTTLFDKLSAILPW